MNLALFDFDGTLTDREMFPLFVRHAVPRRRLWLGQLLFALPALGYRLGWISGRAIRRWLVGYAFRGMAADALARAGETFAQTALPPVLRPEAMARLRWHQQCGDTVVVVSGALELYLAPWCAAQGVDLLASRLDVRNGILSGRYRGDQCAGAEKARRVRERYDLAGYVQIYAYGDTIEDRELLALAQRRYYRGQEVERCP